MKLLNFLYKDEELIRSLYAQVYGGFLRQVSKDESHEKQIGGHVGIDFCVSGGGEYKNITNKLKNELIDPHDTLILQMIQYLTDHSKGEKENQKGDSLRCEGSLLLLPYQLRKALFYSHDMRATFLPKENDTESRKK